MPQACIACRDSKRSCTYGTLDGQRTKCSSCTRTKKVCRYEVKDSGGEPIKQESGQCTDIESETLVESEDESVASPSDVDQ
ncbi:hypothetical protein CERSUDRAFT_87133 [Gelatoporia subvermispora B]|uniref:Uncharacterized protein n=1 Tax=Ceriporiopsis subvermispora (strain B) TaxID=914234 RepID=M2R4G1_CERS8|nr:hypothetical protein CERSUDRAFT_87133 [Gelatoporia subvermispora B]